MSTFFLVLLAIMVFIGESMAWPGFLSTPRRRSAAGIATYLVTAVTGVHLVKVQIQRHYNHMPWYDEDDFWRSVLQLPPPQRPLLPIPDPLPMSIDYVHVWNSTSSESDLLEVESDLHMLLNAAVYEANSSAAFVFFKTYTADFGNFNTFPGDSVNGSMPMQLAPEYEIPGLEDDFDYILCAFWLVVALAAVMGIFSIRLAIRFGSTVSKLDIAMTTIGQLRRLVQGKADVYAKSEALWKRGKDSLETIIANKQTKINDLQAMIDSMKPQIDTLAATFTLIKTENQRLESEIESTKSAHERQLAAKDEEISALKAANATPKPAIPASTPPFSNDAAPKPKENAAAKPTKGAEPASKPTVEPPIDAPKGPKADTTPPTLSYSNNTVYFNADACRRDRTNAPLATHQTSSNPSPSSSSLSTSTPPPPPKGNSSRPFGPKMTKAEEKKMMAESMERVKKRNEVAAAKAKEEEQEQGTGS